MEETRIDYEYITLPFIEKHKSFSLQVSFFNIFCDVIFFFLICDADSVGGSFYPVVGV